MRSRFKVKIVQLKTPIAEFLGKTLDDLAKENVDFKLEGLFPMINGTLIIVYTYFTPLEEER